MPLSRFELLQQLENIRSERNTGTLLAITLHQRCASITFDDGVIVAATFGTSFGLDALKALNDDEFASTSFKKNYALRFPMAEISDPQQAHDVLATDGFEFRPPAEAATPAAPAPQTESTPAPSSGDQSAPQTPQVAIDHARLAIIENVVNDILGRPKGSEVFRSALEQLDDELEEGDALQLLLVLMFDQIEDADSADRFVKQISKTLALNK